ncbi:hypothetical protein E3N88_00554 [Mikania micrantha]|uniref:Uncharacterized protein n=1 Tax=Mikania micrantha TaxID=192012 RepID=A0A5N6Q0J7_9ASTR|nr:hypothetical protein E3N88_00554 [Mikania micrantha]
MLMVTDDKLSGMSSGTKHLCLPCRKLHAYDNGITASDQASFLTKLRLYFSDVHEHVFLTKCAIRLLVWQQPMKFFFKLRLGNPQNQEKGVYDISEMNSGHNKTDSLVRDSDDIYKMMDGSVLHIMELTDIFSPTHLNHSHDSFPTESDVLEIDWDLTLSGFGFISPEGDCWKIRTDEAKPPFK